MSSQADPPEASDLGPELPLHKIGKRQSENSGGVGLGIEGSKEPVSRAQTNLQGEKKTNDLGEAGFLF